MHPPSVVWQKLAEKGFDPKDLKNGGDSAKAILLVLSLMALAGDTKAAALLIKTAEPGQKVELTGAGGVPLFDPRPIREIAANNPKAREAMKLLAAALDEEDLNS